MCCPTDSHFHSYGIVSGNNNLWCSKWTFDVRSTGVSIGWLNIRTWLLCKKNKRRRTTDSVCLSTYGAQEKTKTKTERRFPTLYNINKVVNANLNVGFINFLLGLVCRETRKPFLFTKVWICEFVNLWICEFVNFAYLHLSFGCRIYNYFSN